MGFQTNKLHIKYLFISRILKEKTVLDIGIVTDDLKYIEYEVTFRVDKISESTIFRLNALFRDFRIDKTTDVCLYRIREADSICLYLRILQQQMQFNIHSVELGKMCRRIFAYHGVSRRKNLKDRQVTKWYFKQVWRYLVDRNKCPWITQQFDDSLHLKSPEYEKRKRVVRFGAYYMFVKEYLSHKVAQSESKRSANHTISEIQQI